MSEECFRSRKGTSDSATTKLKSQQDELSPPNRQKVTGPTKTTHTERWLVRDQLAYLEDDTEDHIQDSASLPEGCPDCQRETIYDTEEEAVEHLQESHALESSPNPTLLRDRICALQVIAKEKERVEYLATLRLCRDCMLRILAKAGEVRDGLDFGHGFKVPPHGLPNALLLAFESMILLMCAARFTLETLTWFFEEDVYLKGDLSESTEKLQAHREILSVFAASVEDQIREAQGQIVSSIGETVRNSDTDIKHPTVVGARYIISQMVCSLLEKPVYNGMRIAGLYRKYLMIEVYCPFSFSCSRLLLLDDSAKHLTLVFFTAFSCHPSFEQESDSQYGSIQRRT